MPSSVMKVFVTNFLMMIFLVPSISVDHRFNAKIAENAKGAKVFMIFLACFASVSFCFILIQFVIY